MIELHNNMGYFYFCYKQRGRTYYQLYISRSHQHTKYDRYVWDYGYWK